MDRIFTKKIEEKETEKNKKKISEKMNARLA